MQEPPAFQAAPDRPDQLPIGDETENLIKAIENIGPARVRHAGRSAFMHLRKAWILHPIDSEMSMFRALTAVEEAGTATILALKQQRYPGADRLNAQDHVHKAAVWPLIEAIIRGYQKKEMPKPVLSVASEGRPRISISVDIGPIVGADKPLWMNSPDPFHVLIHSDEKGPFEVHKWERELAEIAGSHTDVSTYLREEANLRNRILYAGEQGIPAVRFPDRLILRQLERVKWMMFVVIGILQTKTLQYLVIQGLEALLIAIRRLTGDGYDFPTHQRPEGSHISVEQMPDGSFDAKLVK